MANLLTFDTLTIGATDYGPDVMKWGGQYSPDMKTEETVVRDGSVLSVPQYKGGTASCELFGQQLVVNTGYGLSSVDIKLMVGAIDLLADKGKGIVGTSYDEATHRTALEIKIDPTIDPA